MNNDTFESRGMKSKCTLATIDFPSNARGLFDKVRRFQRITQMGIDSQARQVRTASTIFSFNCYKSKYVRKLKNSEEKNLQKLLIFFFTYQHEFPISVMPIDNIDLSRWLTNHINFLSSSSSFSANGHKLAHIERFNWKSFSFARKDSEFIFFVHHRGLFIHIQSS